MSSTVTIDLSQNEKQELAYKYLTDDKTTIVFYGGAINSGKSYLLATWLFTLCVQYPGVRCFIARKELKQLRSTFLMTFNKLIYNLDLVPADTYKFNGQDNYISFENGSRIDLLDARYEPSDPEYQRFGSYEFTAGAWEEIGESTDEREKRCLEVLLTRIGRAKNEEYGIKSKILATMNPTRGWVKTFSYDRFRDECLPDDIQFIQALPDDNPYVSEDYKKTVLEHLSPADKRRLWYGDWDSFEQDKNALVTLEEIQQVFKLDAAVPGTGEYYLTVDVARFGKDSTVFCLWNGNRCEKIQTVKKADTRKVAAFIRGFAAQYKIPDDKIGIDEVGVGGGVLDQSGGKGFIANARPLEDGNFNNLKSQCLYKLADAIRKKQIYINVAASDKQRLIEELEAQLIAADLDADMKQKVINKDAVKNRIGRSPDIVDALAIRFFLPKSKKVDNLEGIGVQTHEFFVI